jgi:hypothetical protein
VDVVCDSPKAHVLMKLSPVRDEMIVYLYFFRKLLFSCLRIVFIGPITNKKVCIPAGRRFFYKQALPQNFLTLWLAITKCFASSAFLSLDVIESILPVRV